MGNKKRENLIVNTKEKKNVGKIKKKLIEKVDSANLKEIINFGKKHKRWSYYLECGSSAEAITVLHSIEHDLGDQFIVIQSKRV